MVKDFSIRSNRFSIKFKVIITIVCAFGVLCCAYLASIAVSSMPKEESSYSNTTQANRNFVAVNDVKKSFSSGNGKIVSKKLPFLEKNKKFVNCLNSKAEAQKSENVADSNEPLESFEPKEVAVENDSQPESTSTDISENQESQNVLALEEGSQETESNVYLSSEQFRTEGVVYSNGTEYKWYSQNVLPGDGLDIPGRHVEDGYVVDENGYVCVASQDYEMGTELDIPVGNGKGKVYDYCEDAGVVDVYVDF